MQGSHGSQEGRELQGSLESQTRSFMKVTPVNDSINLESTLKEFERSGGDNVREDDKRGDLTVSQTDSQPMQSPTDSPLKFETSYEIVNAQHRGFLHEEQVRREAIASGQAG